MLLYVGSSSGAMELGSIGHDITMFALLPSPQLQPTVGWGTHQNASGKLGAHVQSTLVLVSLQFELARPAQGIMLSTTNKIRSDTRNHL